MMALWLLACADDPAAKVQDSRSSSTAPDLASEPTPDEVLATVRANRDAGLSAWSTSHGWPVKTTDGWLFVTAGSLLLAGDHDDWAGTPMNPESGFSWLVLPDLSAGSRYKYTDGAERWEADRWSRAYATDEFGEMSLVAPVEAHLERFFSVEDGVLAARDLHLWVPAGTPTHVLYSHDGQNLFDRQASWGGWRLDESAPPGLLIVGIDNTVDRMDEYTHVRDKLHGEWIGGNGALYAEYVENTVRPLVHRVYSEPTVVGTLGSSLGGLISFEIPRLYPGSYRVLGSLSGPLGWGSIGAQEETMIALYAAAGHQDTAIYLDSGGSGTTCADSDGDGTNDDDFESSDNYCTTMQMKAVLESSGYTYDTDLWHWHEPNAEHNEAEWAARVARPLELFVNLD